MPAFGIRERTKRERTKRWHSGRDGALRWAGRRLIRRPCDWRFQNAPTSAQGASGGDGRGEWPDGEAAEGDSRFGWGRVSPELVTGWGQVICYLEPVLMMQKRSTPDRVWLVRRKSAAPHRR